MVKEFRCAIKGAFRKSGARAMMPTEFSSRKGSECLGVATEHDLYKNIGDIDMCTEFEKHKVKVPVIFLGSVGFSLSQSRGWSLSANLMDIPQTSTPLQSPSALTHYSFLATEPDIGS